MSGSVVDIKHIISANGWLAVYTSKKPPYYFTDRLVCFGVVRKERYTESINRCKKDDADIIVGFSAGDFIDAVDDDDNCLCYCHELEVDKNIDWFTKKGMEKGKGKN